MNVEGGEIGDGRSLRMCAVAWRKEGKEEREGGEGGEGARSE